MKKSILTGLGVLALGATVAVAGFGNGFTGAPSPKVLTANITGNNVQCLLTNNVEVVGITAITAAGSGLINFFDNNKTYAPYYGTNAVTAQYLSRAGYATNYVTSYVGYNGYTNWYTNSGYWTYTVTNAAATNAMSPKVSLYANSSSIASIDNNVSFMQGITVMGQTNQTLIIYYIPNN